MLEQELRYESYKDSGEIWLGKVPTDWSLESIRAVTELKSKRGEPDLRVLSVYRDYGVIPKDSRDDNHNATSLDTSNYKVVEPGDLVVNKMKAWQGSMGVSEHRGIVSPAYITCKTDADKVVPRFLHYLLRSQPFIAVYNSLSYGVRIGQWDMHYEDFKKIPLAYPDLDTQNRIVSFLDEKTAEIDAAIAKKRRLIDLLNEQKATLINRAVTKGLNPDAPMKNSGVDWIGEIPAHWEAASLKHYCSLIKDGLHHTPEKYDEGANFISTQHVRHRKIAIATATKISLKDYQSGHTKAAPEAGDVLITLVGSIGFSAIVRDDHLPLSCTRHVGYVRCRPATLRNDYLVEYFESAAFNRFVGEFVSQTAQPSIYLATLADHKIPVPPLEEQTTISTECASIANRFNSIIELEQTSISTLTEFKQTLIANAVTGKIKI